MSFDQTVTTAPPAPWDKAVLTLTLGALGVVYGDIGTSPLYALRECFHGAHGVEVSSGNVLGVLSLVFWSLVVILCAKYMALVLRADNRGEGGELALTALALRAMKDARATRAAVIALGMVGAALLYGDGMITPAISVMSAVDGLKVATPFFQPYLVPITLAILVGLFLVQSHGTGRIGAVFGPIILVWFGVISVLGIVAITRHWTVLGAVNPLHAVRFFAHNGARGFFVLSSVFLATTGAEALYADMGHFGRRAIRLGWFVAAYPALLLNYFGQGALLLSDASAADNPFYRLAPPWLLYPLVVLATCATVIASQAMISGAFSITRQAVQLGFLPRLEIRHTSSAAIGQIYVPLVNWALLAGTAILVIGFGSSSRLAAAYGVGVSTTMVITTLLIFFVARSRWKWRLPATLAVVGFFLVVDLAFWFANASKLALGGWVAIAVGVGVFVLLSTWHRGRIIMRDVLHERAFPFEKFVEDAARHPPLRAPGTAVFMTGTLDGTPSALLHNIKNNRVLHENVVLLRVVTEEIPHVPPAERVQSECVAPGFWRVKVRYGFTDAPNVPYALELLRGRPGAPDLSPGKTSYFLGHDTLIATNRRGMARWRKKLFVFMNRNAQQATTFFQIPPGRVVEIGAQLEL